ncbi:peptidase domain-containing ABC transporter [Synechococcus sp. MU1611]|uniref:peptidase domain-containing ABC transporter n=1 Tax=Synechococcus sp. MU1611 TaxID=2508345 RepID=UPI001CF7F6F5|nr:peptidase domain-containing ABC transporter [Synechococcus sp. MU1611]MCB4411498.1 ATP-binding cassette domain-containing protein [Synechococcus sp. MU1611]
MTLSNAATDSVISQILKQPPFSLLTNNLQKQLFDGSKLVKFQQGQTLLRPNEFNKNIFLILDGSIRLLVEHPIQKSPRTIQVSKSGQLIGWVNLLRASPCEWVSAKTEVTALAISSKQFINCVQNSEEFMTNFASISSPHEVYDTALNVFISKEQLRDNWFDELLDLIPYGRALSINEGEKLSLMATNLKQYSWYLSTPHAAGLKIGRQMFDGDQIPESPDFKLPYRLIGFEVERLNGNKVEPENRSLPPADSLTLPTDLKSLGIIEADTLDDTDAFPIKIGKGTLNLAMAICEMVALHQKVPFRSDAVEKALRANFKRNKELSLEMLGALFEMLGLKTQIGSVKTSNFLAVETPAVIFLNDIPSIVISCGSNLVKIVSPVDGLQTIDFREFSKTVGERVRFAIPRRIGSTPTARFDWSWFLPLVKKYRVSLGLVFGASLLAQLIGLAIPLLIQQIIDKVLTQGNLSTLNIIGGAMIVLALLQGVLNVLRTYVFVDTTDRMDLTLGSAVIDRLLGLPLTYFERRPVGELSQRLGELNTIRSFITGTALVSVLNIIFALMYLMVMLAYSPFLTAVALSTLPLYIILVFVVAPIYKSLIRKRAVASARTQSHLIEILNGIQTVKAQHFELTARWKWQDRYRHFVTEGFKSTALGATSSQIGSFLNTLSSLLVLWIGMGLVLQGQLTLGMLIAFRIISGNVTKPLLQLSTLYQGFQTVQLSMERLGDILNQAPELSNGEAATQISLPVMEGAIRFENVNFRFTNNGPYQVDGVSLNIPSGSFVGIVGQSGSGKSTLMKLLPRLYNVESGRIFVDDYDISKVDLSSLRRQVGIVPQDSLLFEGTIAENISLNDPNASTESIIEAARLACAHDFIMSLGQGYATPLAERGGNLSGGQRQRIAIARTILSNPQLLIMDEATSALDYNTEAALSRNIQEWAQARTVFFITHRLSSIRSSHIILVMHEGKLVESGTHEELMNLQGRYFALYRQQSD